MWNNHMIIARLKMQPPKHKVAPFLHCIGDDALKLLTQHLPPEARLSYITESFRARKAISKTMKRLMKRAFYFNRFCIETKLTLIRFKSKTFFVFQLRAFEVGFSGLSRNGPQIPFPRLNFMHEKYVFQYVFPLLAHTKSEKGLFFECFSQQSETTIHLRITYHIRV